MNVLELLPRYAAWRGQPAIVICIIGISLRALKASLLGYRQNFQRQKQQLDYNNYLSLLEERLEDKKMNEIEVIGLSKWLATTRPRHQPMRQEINHE
ncbi:hypothetical protein [Thiohalophilus thiocyanatoxydans]|uniref:Uncharacterized protein n=1 Tax=Thiohalophilus thiocyanatoxydans TaxID=381308 RepID=A0A4R8ISA9_9GAMM|nr:hypothetical protein [Thiohalophilus thiocyanatoxydans]TDY00063.1 hypothetical protein EDC23_2227 [Thiohalophilus thiocyanatoxydans]